MTSPSEAQQPTWHGASIGAWLSTAVIIAGTIVGGIGLIETFLGVTFWIGVAMFVVGWIAAFLTGIMKAVH